MSNPFPFPQPVQHNTAPAQYPNADPAFAAFLAQMAQQAPVQQYAPQTFPAALQQYAPPAPAVPLAQGSLDDFYGQPSVGGGAAWKFENIGDSHTGIVSRAIGQGDISQVTDIDDKPQFFKDGRPKFQMTVPLTNVDGTDATWYVKGADREELSRAMGEAGAPTGPPEKGAAIRVTFVRTKQNGAKYSASKIKTVEYIRPTGSAPVAPAQPTPQPTPAPAPAPIHPVQTPAPVQAPAAPVQQAAPAPAAVTLDADQAALLAKLTGG